MTWIVEDWTIILHAIITSVIMLMVMLIVIKINGLRSFAKFSPIDFAVTITIGSVINSTIVSDSNSILKGALVILVLIGVQTILSYFKLQSKWFDKKVFNQPILLMKDGKFLDKNLKATNVSKVSILAKLRENNVNHLKNVKVVVLETTGDISVITGGEVDDLILSDVRTSPQDNPKQKIR